MIGVKKIIFLVLLIALFSVSATGHWVIAQQQTPSLDNLKNQIPAPVNDFINSTQKVGNDISYNGNWISRLNVMNPKAVFRSIDDWFYNTTGGTRLVDILKPVGNLLVWLFSTLANLIKWALSFL